METFVTDLGYCVKETIDGLDVYEDDYFVCELKGHTFANYTYNEKIDNDKLDSAIKDEIEAVKFLYELRLR